MMLQEIIGKLITGERDGTTLWKIALGEIDYEPITDPAQGVSVASLAENMLRFGQLQPILLYRPKGKKTGAGRYRLIAGRRRLEAMRMLGRTHISAIVVACEEGQAPLLSLTENFHRRDPHYLDLAKTINRLIKEGWELSKLAQILSLSEDRLNALLELQTLPEDECRLLRLGGLELEDALKLLTLPPLPRRALLEKCCSSAHTDPSKLIDAYIQNPDPRYTQSQKIMVTDVRIFLNTVDRAAETMGKAGYDTKIQRNEDAASYTFTIQVAKKQGCPLAPPAFHVSRETSRSLPRENRISGLLNIFEAIAQDEQELSVHKDTSNVSRETSNIPKKADCVLAKDGEENAEKLEICIDEWAKR